MTSDLNDFIFSSFFLFVLIMSDREEKHTTSDTPSLNSEEPPAKKCKILSNEKSRLLEERIGSILSCCICLDLSILAMFQVKKNKQHIFYKKNCD